MFHYMVVVYAGGYYHGKLLFPRDYPFKPPRIIMITPNGRFKTNTRLCLSISDFHPDTWNPAWSVATILTGLLSFMVREGLGSYVLGLEPDSQLTRKKFFNGKMQTTDDAKAMEKLTVNQALVIVFLYSLFFCC